MEISLSSPQPLSPGETWLQYPGSKRLLAKEILERFPSHKLYVEVFGGSAAVLLQKPFNPRVQEVYNDLNGELSNLFWVVQNRFEEFCAKASWGIRSRPIWQVWKQIDLQTLDAVIRAVRYLYLIRTSFGSKQDFSSFAVHYGRHSGRSSGPVVPSFKTLYKVHERLRDVIIEQTSYEKLVSRFDRDDVFFYLDPPYEVTAGKTHYEFSWPLEEHNCLYDVLGNVKGKWLLSYNDSPRIRELYSNFIIEEVIAPYSIFPKAERRQTELLIRNYKLKNQGKLDDFLG